LSPAETCPEVVPPNYTDEMCLCLCQIIALCALIYERWLSALHNQGHQLSCCSKKLFIRFEAYTSCILSECSLRTNPGPERFFWSEPEEKQVNILVSRGAVREKNRIAKVCVWFAHARAGNVRFPWEQLKGVTSVIVRRIEPSAWWRNKKGTYSIRASASIWLSKRLGSALAFLTTRRPTFRKMRPIHLFLLSRSRTTIYLHCSSQHQIMHLYSEGIVPARALFVTKRPCFQRHWRVCAPETQRN
jgi:hypothetical protein